MTDTPTTTGPVEAEYVLVPREPTERDKQRARRHVRAAIQRGDLIRPPVCERCGKPPKQCSDGRQYIQAHHHDYDKPLDVEWLCAACHRAETPLPERPGAPAVGSVNGQSRLTEEAVRYIRASSRTAKQLAATFGVHFKTIQHARIGRYWRHVR